jgi:hypothetical protein
MRSSISSRESEQGNIFFYILIAIALFAALGYAVSRSGSGKGLDQERARLVASELMAQANSVRDAVARMRVKGITREQISFQNNIVTAGYTNAACTTDFCRVFLPDGGGMMWPQPPSGASTTGLQWLFSSDLSIANIGRDTGCAAATPCGDLAMMLADIDDNVCRHINFITHNYALTAALPARTTGSAIFTKFTGSYAASPYTLDTTHLGTSANPNPICVTLTGTSLVPFEGTGSATSNVFIQILSPAP